MTNPILSLPIFRAFDAAGVPLAGGHLYTYAANSLTQKTTYASADNSSPNANPVVLDTSGTAVVRLGSGAYKFVLKDSTDATTYWTVDNYQSSYLTQADIGGLLWPQTTAETSASVTPTYYYYPPGDVRRYGAAGNGSTDDTTALTNACLVINAMGGGTITFEAAKNYKVWVGASPNLMTFSSCKGVTIEGNGATLTSGRTNGPGCFAFTFTGCSRSVVRNIKIQGSNTTLTNTTGEALVNLLSGTTQTVIDNCHTKNCATFLQAGDGTTPPLTGRVRGITVLNPVIEDTYYGLGFTGNGDDVFVRGAAGIHTGRVYFAWNVKNHDVWIDGQQEGPYSDCLLKCYGYTGSAYTSLENIRLNYKTEGKSTAATGSGSADALINLEWQMHDVASICYVRDIDITFNVDVANTAGSAKIFHVFNSRKYDTSGNPDATPRGHILENLKLRGTVLNWQNSGGAAGSLYCVAVCDPGNYGGGACDYTGDYVNNIRIEDLYIQDPSVAPAYYTVIVNGQGFITGKPGLLMQNVDASDTKIARLNWNEAFGFSGESVVGQAGYLRCQSAWTTYVPSWTSSGSAPAIGDGTLTGRWRRSGDMVTVDISMVCGASTTYGTGDYRFSMPFTAGATVNAVGTGILKDSGGNAYPVATTVLAGETVVRMYEKAVASPGLVTGASPMSWSASDVIDLQITYRCGISS